MPETSHSSSSKPQPVCKSRAEGRCNQAFYDELLIVITASCTADVEMLA